MLLFKIFSHLLLYGPTPEDSTCLRAIDKNTGDAVVGAHVTGLSGQVTSVTDSKGETCFTQGSDSCYTVQSLHYVADTICLSQSTSATIYLKPDYRQLNEVVVSGNLRQVTKGDSPIPVEVYSAQLWRQNPAPSLFDALQMVNGVQPQLNCNVCNAGDIHINGLEGPYTMVLIDGIPSVSSLSSVYGLQGIPTSMIRRIEVVKGPAAAVYGSEAVAGVINVITRDAACAPRFKSDFNATTYGEFYTDLSGTINHKKFSSLWGITYFNYQIPADINNDNFTDVTLQNRLAIFQKWDFKNRHGLPSSFSTRYVYEYRWGGELNWSRKWQGSDSIYGECITTHRAELFGAQGFRVKNADLRLDYSANTHFQESYYGTTHYRAQQHNVFAQLVLQKNWNLIHLTAGTPLRLSYYDDNTPATGAGGQKSSLNKFSWLPGLFVQSEIKPEGIFSALLALRYDYHSAHGSIWTPRLNFKFRLNRYHALRITGGSGYRVVNLFTEEHAALTGSRSVEIAETLLPEKSWNVNLNYNGTWNHTHGFLETDVHLFYTYFTNRIGIDYESDPQKIIFSNTPEGATSRGGSFTINANFNFGLTANAGITVMDVFRTAKNMRQPQLFAPLYTANFTIGYQVPVIKIKIDLTGRVNGPMQLPVLPNDFRPEKSPAYCLMNLQLSRQLPNHFEVYAGVKNLLHFVPEDPILRPFDPFDKNTETDNPMGYTFDTNYNYAPVQGIKGFIGFRYLLP